MTSSQSNQQQPHPQQPQQQQPAVQFYYPQQPMMYPTATPLPMGTPQPIYYVLPQQSQIPQNVDAIAQTQFQAIPAVNQPLYPAPQPIIPQEPFFSTVPTQNNSSDHASIQVEQAQPQQPQPQQPQQPQQACPMQSGGCCFARWRQNGCCRKRSGACAMLTLCILSGITLILAPNPVSIGLVILHLVGFIAATQKNAPLLGLYGALNLVPSIFFSWVLIHFIGKLLRGSWWISDNFWWFLPLLSFITFMHWGASGRAFCMSKRIRMGQLQAAAAAQPAQPQVQYVMVPAPAPVAAPQNPEQQQ